MTATSTVSALSQLATPPLVRGLKIARKLSRDRQDDAIWDNFRTLIRDGDAIWDNFRILKELGFLDGREVAIEDIASGVQTVTVSHGLNREPRGWLVTRTVKSWVAYEDSATVTTISFVVEGFGIGDRTATVVVF